MSKTLSLGVVLGATMTGNFGGVINSAKSTLTSLGSVTKTLTKEFKELKKQMDLGPMQSVGRFNALSSVLEKAKKNSDALNKSLKAHQEAKAYRSNVMGDMGRTVAMGAAVAVPLGGAVKAFMDQDKSSTNMKMAFMKAGGGVSEAFDLIKNKALDLGNALPGTTADFMDLGRVLKEQGLADDVIKNGALESAAKLNVLLGTSQEFGGEFIAKMMEARGIADTDLDKAADMVQRARFAFGMKPQDMMDTMKYDAPVMNVLGIKGLENTSKMFALQGMGATTGLEGAQWGTNFRQLMLRMGEGVDTLKGAKKGNKAVARGQMESAGVDFQFYDDKGKFKGLEGMVKEMEKLKTIKEKLGEKAALNVASEVFGAEAAGAALIIADKGIAGMDANIKKMAEQASMQERMAEQSKSLSNIWESLTGTAVNLAAAFGGVFGADLAVMMGNANEFISNTLMPWVSENKGLIKTVVEVGAALLGMRLGLGLLKLGFSTVTGPLRGFRTALNFTNGMKSLYQMERLLGGGKLQSGLRALGMPAWLSKGIVFSVGKVGGLGGIQKIFGVFRAQLGGVQKLFGFFRNLRLAYAINGVRGVAAAFGILGAVSLPVVAIVAAVALAGLAIWKYWKPIKGFFTGLWSGFKSSAGPILPLLQKIGSIAGMVFAPLFLPLRLVARLAQPVVNWFKNIAKQEEDVGGKAQAMGMRIGTAIGSAVKAVVNFVQSAIARFNALKSYFSSLPSVFMGYGRDIMQGLINGISSMFNSVVDKIKSVGTAIKSAITGTGPGGQDIRSPSRVWRGFGGFIMEGLSIGLGAQSKGVLSQVQHFGAGLQQAFAPKMELPDMSLPKAGKKTPKAAASDAKGEIGGTSAQTDGITFNIYQQAGQDARALAEEVLRLLEQKAGLKRRSRIGDVA